MPANQAPDVSLLERHLECGAIEELIRQTPTTDGALAIVEGPAGIGKTRLLLHARNAGAQQGLRVLTARGGEYERDFAFGVVRQLFERELSERPAAERDRLLDGAAGLARTVFDQGSIAPSPPSSGDVAFRTLHGLYWLLVNVVGTQPTLLVLDDAHHADAASLRWLHYAARRLEGLPVALLLAYRPGEPLSEEPLLRALREEAGPAVLRPRPLGRSAVEELLQAKLPGADDALTDAVLNATGGSPFFVHQIAGALARHDLDPSLPSQALVDRLGTEALAPTVLHRLHRLDPETLRFVKAMAILGEAPSVRMPAKLAGLGLPAASDAAATLLEQGVLASMEPVAFAHTLVQEIAYRDIPAAERAAGHARAARILKDDGADVPRIAAHLLLCGPLHEEWVLDVLTAGARSAMAAGAPETTRSYLRRAMREARDDATRSRLLLALGRAQLTLRDPEGIASLSRAAAMAPDPVVAGKASLALTPALIDRGESPDAVRRLAEARRAIGDRDPALADVLEATCVFMAKLDLALDRKRARAAMEASGGPGQPGSLAQAIASIRLTSTSGTAAADAETTRSTLDRYESQRPAPPLLRLTAGISLTKSEALADAKAQLTGIIDVARRHVEPFTLAPALVWRSAVLLRLGEVRASEADAYTALEWSDSLMAALACARLADALVEQGRVEEACRIFTQARVFEAELNPDSVYTPPVLFSRGRLRILSGDVDAGIDDLRLCGALEDAWEPARSSTGWRSSAAMALAARGERDEALGIIASEIAAGREFGAPRPLGAALRAAGLITGGDAGVELLDEAVTILRGSPARLELARAETDLGASLRRQGRRQKARTHLRHGLDLAQSCGATVIAQRAHEELVIAGARPRRLRISGLESLTSSEHRVASMAADGLSNRDIAEALFVTENTVEVHLVRTYRKLDISSRTELAGALRPDRSPSRPVADAARPRPARVALR